MHRDQRMAVVVAVLTFGTGVLDVLVLRLGLQGAAVRGLGVALATTYLTGTLTGLIANRTLSKPSRADAAGLAALIAAVAGAACGGLTLATVPIVAPVWCLVSVATVIAISEWRHRHAVDHVPQ
jgi:uncharacterized membrane protein YoaK (UPF0700 family)